jgi:hypothetical protein
MTVVHRKTGSPPTFPTPALGVDWPRIVSTWVLILGLSSYVAIFLSPGVLHQPRPTNPSTASAAGKLISQFEEVRVVSVCDQQIALGYLSPSRSSFAAV